MALYHKTYLQNQLDSYDSYVQSEKHFRAKIPQELHIYLVDRYSGDSYYNNYEELPSDLRNGYLNESFYDWRAYDNAINRLKGLRNDIAALKEAMGETWDKVFELRGDGEIQDLLKDKLCRTGANIKAWPYNCINWSRAVEDFKRPLAQIDFRGEKHSVVIL